MRGFGFFREDTPAALDPWSRRHLNELCELEARALGAAAGQTLLHFDVRQDNLLIDDRGAVWVVDWPWAAVGAVWVDVVLMARPSRCRAVLRRERRWRSPATLRQPTQARSTP